ncbi:MAG: hypothetical protein BWX88_03841 [Planctomycetes bacterium ADurb.Bin126]|nr:MAG: hypothetical protein BWX88_03841 [Planctomycetes bacterium ADurb.Bin126]
MRKRWSRERIIRHLLEREAQGLPLTIGGKGVDPSLYQAAGRTFGSWRNALQAAGIAPQQKMRWERWTPARILVMIRNLARRARPLTTQQMERRYHRIVSAARRHFGSWTKAVVAAGVEPTRLQRFVIWSPERVLEAILTRALRNEPLVARLIRPRSLVEAGQRFFGSWPAAVTAAGLDPALTVLPPSQNTRSEPKKARVLRGGSVRTHQRPWTKEQVIAAIFARLQEQKPINAAALRREDYCLYQAMRRLMKNWHETMREAGLAPEVYRCGSGGVPPSTEAKPRDSVARQSQADETLRPDRPA